MTKITLDLDFILDFLDVSRNARINITSNISFPESSRVTLDPQSALVEVDGRNLCLTQYTRHSIIIGAIAEVSTTLSLVITTRKLLYTSMYAVLAVSIV